MIRTSDPAGGRPRPRPRPRAHPVADLLSRWCTRRPQVVLLAAAGLTAGAAVLAGRLHLDTDFSALLPPDNPSVRALRDLQAQVGGESHLAVVIESPSFEANRTFAEALIPRALQLRRPETGDPFFPDVDYLRDVDFLADHALYLATDEELDRIEYELREAIARARLAERPSLGNLLRKEAVRSSAPAAGHTPVALRELLPSRYPISPDSTVLVLRFSVSGAQTDLGFVEEAIGRLAAEVTNLAPSTFHPEMRVAFGDRVARQLVEVKAILRDVRVSLIAGASAVLLVVFAYFGGGRRRTFSAALRAVFVIGTPLIMSLVWTFGFADLVFGSLNLFTATLGLVLFGLGIDYGVHYHARYLQAREAGFDRTSGIVEAHRSIGGAIAASTATTAVPLFVLVGAEFRGFSEFGVIGGMGVVFAAVAMVTVLPALVAVLPDFATGQRTTERSPLRSPRWRTSAVVVGAGVVLLASAPYTARRLSFEYDFSALEPRYPAYEAVNRKFRLVFPRRGNPPAYVLADDAVQADVVARSVRQLAAADSVTPTIDRVEAFADRFPVDSAAVRRKLDRLARIRTLASDPWLEHQEDDDLSVLRRAASTTHPIPPDSLPGVVARTFAGRDGELGRYLLVYPSVPLSDGRRSMEFAADIGEFTAEDGRVYHGASTSIVAASMLRTMLDESPRMIAISLGSIVILMLISFRSFRWAGLALVPLVVGAAGIAGLFALLGLKLNFYNLAAIPAVLGIGNDCGVHLAHRYRQEGPGSVGAVLRDAGEPVAIGGLTTMVGFSGLLLTTHPGLTSIGQLAALGVGVILLTTLLVQPALFRLLEGP